LAEIDTHPTALPRKNIQTHNIGKLGEKLAPIPKTAVRKRVALNGKARPNISETVPQPTAPIIICTSAQGLYKQLDRLTPAIVEAERSPTTSDVRSK
jgi:hypothetical protein